jgi:cell division protein FtsL
VVADQPSRRSRAASQRSKRSRAKREARVKRLRIQRPTMRLALFLVVLVGLLFAFVYPTRTFLDQRSQTNKARAQLEVLQSENARLAHESKRLSTDSEIERLAREKYGLVKPGERPFVILPSPTTPTTTPAAPTSTEPPAP